MAHGFDAVGFARPDGLGAAADRLREFLALGRHGEMDWLVEKAERRCDPTVLWPEARAVIVLGLNYAPAEDPLSLLARPERGSVSCYARNRDYHDLIKGRLKQFGGWLAARYGAQIKVFVDTAPVLEKPLAQAAGLGWQGKHTNLVSRGHGSWLFLGSVFTDLDLPPDAAEPDHCGSCRACLDACPTDAFPAPYQLDARRCISYLTIEHAGPIPHEFRSAIGNRIYGCDDCLAACPWNKFAAASHELAFLPRVELTAPMLSHLVGLDDAGFRAVFSGSPIKRIGRARFVRNVLVAIGNSGDGALIPCVRAQLGDADAVVRGAAIWALGRLMDAGAFAVLRSGHLPIETESAVRAEWLAVG